MLFYLYSICRGGMLSESEFEDDATNQVILPQKLASRGNMEQGKSAIRLSELGPRITMQLIKIEDGLLDGDVLYHDLIHKTEEEKAEIKKRLEMKKYVVNRLFSTVMITHISYILGNLKKNERGFKSKIRMLKKPRRKSTKRNL